MGLTEAQRNKMVSIASYLIAHAPLIHYAEVRPMTTSGLSYAQIKARFAKNESITMDCSEAVTLICRLAGLKDPNGLGYDGQGYTGTLLDHLSHYTNVDRAHAGAIVIFGAAPGTHAAMVMAHDETNPWLFSHGSEIGPLHIRLDDERKAHVGQPVTFLDVAKL